MATTEYKKMLSGEIYHSADPVMLKMHRQARILTSKYNSSPNKTEKFKNKLLKKLLNKIGKNVFIDIPFYTDYGAHISIGNNVIIGMNCVFIDNNKITIGNNVMIASGVQMCTATHPTEAEKRIIKNWNPAMQRNWFHALAKEITIGNNVWIGAGVTVLPGIKIGDNVTIGAGSLVTKNIPANSLALGVPCKVIKKI